MYYDPLLDVHHRVPAFTGLLNTIYLGPQVPDDSRRLFDAALRQMGILDTTGPAITFNTRATAIGLLVARDWGFDELATRLQEGCEANFEPTWSGDEFWWGFGLDEPYPRGQHNALMAAAEATTSGAWTRFANEYEPYGGPELCDVDLGLVGVRQAAWVDGRMLVAIVAASAAAEGRPTSMRVRGLVDAGRYVVDGAVDCRVEGQDLVLELATGPQLLTVRM
jgi:hypothetical protein